MEKEKKFGLIKMQGFAKGAMLGGKPGAPKMKNKPIKPVVFGGDDGDDEEEMKNLRKGVNVTGVNKSIAALQQQSSSIAKTLEENALKEDPTVFQYDELYDEMMEGKEDHAQSRKQDFDPSFGRARKESRYITQLKKSADIRKIDDERVFQMKLKKEADAEAHLYGDKEKFVTTAYKERLSEMGRWKEEDARLAALEQATTIEGKTSMTGFYSNLLTKNLAMGSGDVDKHATSAYTIGSKRNEHIRALEEKQHEESEQKNRSGEKGRKRNGEEDEEEEVDYDKLLERTEASELKRKKVDSDEGVTEGALSSEPPSEPSSSSSRIKVETPHEIKMRKEKEEQERLEELKRKELERVSSALSARERYLARKKEKEAKA
jgi:coiled-coil domain-containing protein 55